MKRGRKLGVEKGEKGVIGWVQTRQEERGKETNAPRMLSFSLNEKVHNTLM